MGCNVSRLDGNGITLPPRLRPIFLQRLNEIKARRHGISPLKSPTPSKKELLHDHKDEYDNVSSYNSSPNISKRMVYSPKEANEKEPEKQREENGKNDMKEGTIEVTNKAKIEHEGRKGENGKKESIEDSNENIEILLTEDEDEDEDDDDGRMIGHGDDESFPGSPSFRVYFKGDGEDGHNDIGKNHAFKETASSDDGLSSKEYSPDNNKVKKGSKRRSFRLPKGGQAAMKNLLNVKSCYTSHSSHTHTRLVSEKTPT